MEVNEEIFEEYFKVIKAIIDSELFYKEAKKQYIKCWYIYSAASTAAQVASGLSVGTIIVTWSPILIRK